MRLADLIDKSGPRPPGLKLQDAEIAGLTEDSRAVGPGYLFAALPGSTRDGAGFIADALAKGAAAILAPAGTQLPPGATATLIADANPRRRLALMAAAFHGAQPKTVVAVTGTNGKTSTAEFTRQLWAAMGTPAASLGTLGLISPSGHRAGSLTTPSSVAIQADLAALAASGVEHLAMEASSHGLDQQRLAGVTLAAAGFTNLTRDHLDYHGSMDAYFDAKARLFTELLPAGGTAVVNADMPEHARIAEIAKARGHRFWSYGRAGRDLTLVAQAGAPGGQTLTLDVFGQRREVFLPVAGSFQGHNLLQALGFVIAAGASVDDALAAVSTLTGVRGRLERVGLHPNGAAVYVDYAHTPDALETVLGALKSHVGGRLWVVFGCGGNRDAGKRPLMGGIASRLADETIVTDDNPRWEDPAAIRAAILAAAPGALEIGDRADAIAHAVRGLGPDDVLLIAGKGHEPGQTIAGETRPFDDGDAARAAIALIKGAA